MWTIQRPSNVFGMNYKLLICIICNLYIQICNPYIQIRCTSYFLIYAYKVDFCMHKVNYIQIRIYIYKIDFCIYKLRYIQIRTYIYKFNFCIYK